MPIIGNQAAHHTTHESGGSDEIDISGLPGAVEIVGTPASGETTKGISSGWAYDHKADPTAHHPAVDPGEGRMFFLAWDYSAIIQGTWTFTYAPNHWFNVFAYNSSNTDEDEINFKAYLAAGTYSVQLVCAKDAAYAISNILIDDTLILTTDHYNATTLNNQLNSATGIVVATSGLKTIKLKVNGRNASCSGWYIPFYSFMIWRTA